MVEPAVHPRPTPEEYSEAVELLRPRMRNVARRILGDAPEVDDIVQDAVIQGLVALDRFRGDARLSTWMHRIVTNAALMQLRRDRRRPERLLGQRGEPRAESELELGPRSAAESPEDQVILRERTQRLRMAIAHEDRRSRELLESCCVEEQSLAEVSARLGISRSAVKTRLFRLRRRLREATGEPVPSPRPPPDAERATA